MFRAAFDNVLGMSRVIWECVGISEGVLGMLGVKGGIRALSGSLFPFYFP